MKSHTQLIVEVARKLLGEPNKQHSTRDDVRYGTNGSMSINPKKGKWYSYEDGVGGGILSLIERETGAKGSARWAKLEELTGYRPDRRASGDGKSRLGQIVATYDYLDAEGEARLRVTRHDPKTFRQWRPVGKGGWRLGAPRDPQHLFLPYRSPDVLEAISAGQPVFVVEGEKDANNGTELGIVATCNAGGAGKWKPQHAAYLKGGDVIVVPDNDSAGRDHAEMVARTLDGIAVRVRLLVLPGLPPKGDLSNWIEAGGTAEQLWALVEQAHDWPIRRPSASLLPQTASCRAWHRRSSRSL